MLLRRPLLLALLVLAASTPAAAAPFHHRWDAASGLRPNQSCPFWTHVDTSSATAVLSGGVLTLATTVSTSNNLNYTDTAPDVSCKQVDNFNAKFRVASAVWRGKSHLVFTGNTDNAPHDHARVRCVMTYIYNTYQ